MIPVRWVSTSPGRSSKKKLVRDADCRQAIVERPGEKCDHRDKQKEQYEEDSISLGQLPEASRLNCQDHERGPGKERISPHHSIPERVEAVDAEVRDGSEGPPQLKQRQEEQRQRDGQP